MANKPIPRRTLLTLSVVIAFLPILNNCKSKAKATVIIGEAIAVAGMVYESDTPLRAFECYTYKKEKEAKKLLLSNMPSEKETPLPKKCWIIAK